MRGFSGAAVYRCGRTIRWIRPVAGLALPLAALVACQGPMAPLPGPAPGAAAPAVDRETEAASAYYAKVQANYLASGRMRRDGGGPDTPFDARTLAANFERVAFFDEFAERGGKLVPGGPEQVLHRWTVPIRMQIDFGPSVPPATQLRDRALVAAYLARLSHLSGLPAHMVDADPNYLVLVEGPSERRAARDRILGFAPQTSRGALDSALHMTPDIYCTVFSYSEGASPVYTSALAVIRSELPDQMREMCYHEELSQGLGLVNDSPQARPSIFNDDEEFALLTRQDALMLRMLYDRRLRPGMTLDEARPIIKTIVAELLPDQS